MANLRHFSADLHLHSVLSPCGDLRVSPASVLRRAREVGLDLIAFTDHNMAENGRALGALAAGSGVAVLYGMELETAEEVHLLCLFDQLEAALQWQETVYAQLPEIDNDADRFGDQVVVDAEENIVRFEPRLLANATEITFAAACAQVEARGGLAIPAHVDRRVQSLISQLGFPPPGLALSAVELSRFAGEEMRRQHPWLNSVPVVRFSDAHFLHEVGAQFTRFQLAAPTLEEIRWALRGEEGRRIAGYGP